MPDIESLKVKLFCDGADLDSILAYRTNPWIKGFTTNPTLMRKAGVVDYEAFGRKLLSVVPDRPISLEVFADDIEGMEAQALSDCQVGQKCKCKDSGHKSGR